MRSCISVHLPDGLVTKNVRDLEGLTFSVSNLSICFEVK